MTDTPAPRKPIPGKGFRKSRRGCFACKRRRVKCSETRPDCHGCRRMGLDCVYPERPVVLSDVCQQAISKAPAVNVCLDHLRFFRHFLLEAYPPHPYGTEGVWQDVAALSHEYSFLASALLALAAQHLTLFTTTDHSVQALGLRVSAINGLNEALSKPCLSASDVDARYATAIALTFQSSYMPDGLMDFVAMMRGWMLISTRLVTDRRASLFGQFTRASFVGSMERFVDEEGCGLLDEEGVEGFMASLRMVAPLCRGEAEKQYLATLERLALLSKTSPRDAMLEMVLCYALTNKMSDDEYASFTSPSNHAAQVLLAHFLVLDRMLERCFRGKPGRHFAFARNIRQAWVAEIGRTLPRGYERYMMWPLGQAMGLEG